MPSGDEAGCLGSVTQHDFCLITCPKARDVLAALHEGLTVWWMLDGGVNQFLWVVLGKELCLRKGLDALEER